MKIKHLILAFGGASLLAACNLDEYPYGFYSEDNFYKTDADAESAVNYIYDAINYIEYSRSIVFLGDMNTDDMEPKGDAAAANKELDGWKINNFKTNTTLGNFYKYSYITINRANAVIKKVPGMNIDEGRRNRFLGEAYFMRAYSYFNLARNFGCVPVHTTPVETLEDTAVPAAEHHPVARVALMANSPMAPRTVISAAPAALPEVNIPAVPKQAMAVMPKRTAKVMPVASMATPALWRFFALVRRSSMGVGTGFFAKKLRAQPGIPPAFSPLGAAFRASSARF